METETTNESNVSAHKKFTISTPAAILTGAVIIALAVIFTNGSGTKVAKDTTTTTTPATEIPKDVATIRSTDHVRGNVDTAKVAIFEYSDSDCVFCGRFHPVLQQVVSDYDGKVAWVYRHFPITSLHPNAATEAVALECVADLGGNDAFNKYLDKIIGITLEATPTANKALTTYATELGVDAKMFESCMKGTAASDRVKANADEAQAIGAQGTPYSIAVNLKTGKQVAIPGAYPIDEVKKIVDGLLK